MKMNMTINQLPTLTWNFLKLNSVNIDEEVALNNRGNLNVEDIPAGMTVERDGKLLANVKTGMGPALDEMMDERNVETLVVRSRAGAIIEKPLILRYSLGEGDGTLRRQEIIAEEGSELTVIMDYSAGRHESGFFGIQTKLYAKAGAVIHIVKTNLLGDKYLHFDAIGAEAEDDGVIDVTQLELGGGRNYVGLEADLRGRKSSYNGNVGYLQRKGQLLDMNYYIRHLGRKSNCELNVKGALDDDAVKNFRGTIDLVHGAKGAVGHELEDTLLLSKNVHNNTLPIILCDEDDVEGTHGASIGRLSEDVLFYMRSRGISEKAAEVLMTKAKLNSVQRLINDEGTVGRIQKYIEEAFGER
ncbi:MAG: SufD family Fe-S cluster assembly protein [Lachnospiraceae bacterium]|nr:SufD family Fe-S cluster assembly protein [Lachnospiraceae bacterium]